MILGDYQDQQFRVADHGRPDRQRGLGVDDPAQCWLDVLFIGSSSVIGSMSIVV